MRFPRSEERLPWSTPLRAEQPTICTRRCASSCDTHQEGSSVLRNHPKKTAHSYFYIFFLLTVLGRTVHFFFSTSCSAASLARFARIPKSRALARAMRRLAKALKFFSSSEITRAFSRLKTWWERAPDSQTAHQRLPEKTVFKA